MNAMASRSVRAVYMRGGNSKGLFLHEADLPRRNELRDRLLMRLVGSPDPFETQCDGMGAGTAGTSKVVIVSATSRPDCDVDYLVGAVSLKEPFIDWSGNCGHLTAAVAPFAVHEGLVRPADGVARIRLWQRNLGQRIDALVPVQGGQVLEHGPFQEEGVAARGAEIQLEFHEPEPTPESLLLLPTGRACEDLKVPGLGSLRVTMITAGRPTVFVRADSLDLTGKEMPERFNRSHARLKQLESIRAQAAVAMGLAESPARATEFQRAMPEIAWVAKPASYRSAGGQEVAAEQVDVLARILSMGKLHDGFSPTGAIALAAAAALPGSLVNEITRTLPGVATRIGHVSGTLAVGADVSQRDGIWRLDKAVLSRSARRLMSGLVHWPNDVAGLGMAGL